MKGAVEGGGIRVLGGCTRVNIYSKLWPSADKVKHEEKRNNG